MDKAANIVKFDRTASGTQYDRYYRECQMCFNCGWTETTRHDQIGRAYRGVIKCHSCDYWLRWIERHVTQPQKI